MIQRGVRSESFNVKITTEHNISLPTPVKMQKKNY